MAATGLRVGQHCGPGGKHCLGSLAMALDSAATALQMFPGSPRRYWGGKTSEEQRDAFVKQGESLYKVVHSVYILNACEKPDLRSATMTRHSLVNQLEWAERHGCEALVFHPGSHKDHDRDDSLQWLDEALREVMISYEGPVKLVLENGAVKDKIGRKITGDIDELAKLAKGPGDERIRICIDTTHAFASGYTVDQMITSMTRHRDILEVVHFNTPSPQVKRNNGVDRHSHTFDEGVFSMRELQLLFYALRDKPLILEGTPDFPSDLVWLLSWEAEIQRTGDLKPAKTSSDLGPLFSPEQVPSSDSEALP